MPKAGTTETITLFRSDEDGVAVTGKVEGDFSFPAYHNGVAVALATANFAEIGAGYYSIDITFPATLGRLRIDPVCLNPTTDELDPPHFEGLVTAHDIDSVAILAAKPPSITLAQNVSARSSFTIEMFAFDGEDVEIPIYDANGNLIDLTGWGNFRFSIKNAEQTAVGTDLPYDLDAGITGSAAGIATVPIPEDCSAYNVHPTGRTKTTLYWSLDANPTGDTTKTKTLRAGQFIIKSKETPTP